MASSPEPYPPCLCDDLRGDGLCLVCASTPEDRGWLRYFDAALAERDLMLLSYASRDWREAMDWAQAEARKQVRRYHVYQTFIGWVASPRPRPHRG